MKSDGFAPIPFVADGAQRDGTVISLDHQRTRRRFVVERRRARRSGQLDVLVYDVPIQSHSLHPRVVRLAAALVEAGGPEVDLKVLPEPGCPSGVDARRHAVEAFTAFLTPLVPPLVDSADVAKAGIADAPAVEELYLVASLQIDARIRACGHHEVELQRQIPMLPGREEVLAVVVGGGADENAGPGLHREMPGTVEIGVHVAREMPVIAGGLERAPVVQRDAAEHVLSLSGCAERQGHPHPQERKKTSRQSSANRYLFEAHSYGFAVQGTACKLGRR